MFPSSASLTKDSNCSDTILDFLLGHHKDEPRKSWCVSLSIKVDVVISHDWITSINISVKTLTNYPSYVIKLTSPALISQREPDLQSVRSALLQIIDVLN